MRFELSTAGNFYSNASEIEKLKKLGFKFEWLEEYNKYAISNYPEIHISTMDELMDFIKEYGRIIIDEGVIKIYDNYLE